MTALGNPADAKNTGKALPADPPRPRQIVAVPNSIPKQHSIIPSPPAYEACCATNNVFVWFMLCFILSSRRSRMQPRRKREECEMMEIRSPMPHLDLQSGRQVRAARALLAWEQAQLAAAANVSAPTIHRMENLGVERCSMPSLFKVQQALNTAGVAFLPVDPNAGWDIGVRLRLVRPAPTSIAKTTEEQSSAPRRG